ncbi:MAG: pimelyl-ACP methyl ester esterase BioV [Sulfurospirillum sp.]|nr:pimelyl-ACP methyl ester esterase BioV [Sulfurospirillum sp.]
MHFFSGFCLRDESDLFDAFTCKSEFCVVGFSYGAIKALEYALHVNTRIDKIQLISPAFFQDKEEKFKKLQTLYFAKDPQKYSEDFLKNIAYPSKILIEKYFHMQSIEELRELLYYEWEGQKLECLRAKGIEIELFIGEKDKIIDPLKVKEFFQPYSTVYFIKNVGHALH